MAGFRCIQVFVILLLEFTAAANGDVLFIYGRDGDGVTLPCTNVRDDQNQCDGTTWTVNKERTRGATDLIQLGKITEEAHDKSDRLSITENCSLVFNKVRHEDAGIYFCRQYDDSGLEHGYGSLVELSVVSLTERQDGDNVTLICSVVTRGQCVSKVRWMYNGVEVESGHPDLTISKSFCSATITFNRGKFYYTSKVHLFKCAVRHNDRIEEFPFRPSSSEEQPDDDLKNNKNTIADLTPTAPGMNTSGNSDTWYLLRNVIGSVGLAALLMSVVTVTIWTRTKGNKTRTRGNTVHKDEGEADGTVQYENLGEPSVSIRFH